jgi:hypothetical protein
MFSIGDTVRYKKKTYRITRILRTQSSTRYKLGDRGRPLWVEDEKKMVKIHANLRVPESVLPPSRASSSARGSRVLDRRQLRSIGAAEIDRMMGCSCSSSVN